MNENQRLLSSSALTTFRLNGQFLSVAEALAAPAGLTATRWQVLGAVLERRLSVSDIARAMGITRQSVQRTADLLAEAGLVVYRDNPAHRRAKLVELTPDGLAAMDRIGPQHAALAERCAEVLGPERWSEIVTGLAELSSVLESLASQPD